MAEQRDRWSTRGTFILAAVGSAVGLGNVWRFPYVAYANGGGAFFIPYFVALLTAGIPLMILELGLGQKMQAGAPQSLGKANKHTEWVGWFALLVGTVISCYYAVIMAYSVEYLVYAFKGFFTGGQMPWSDPSLLSGAEAAKGTPAEANFFINRVVSENTTPGEMWKPVWHLALGLAAVWAAVFWIVYRGVKRVGKVVLWTVPLPVLLLIVLAVRGCTLPGAGEGIAYYLTPDFSKLSEASTWLAAYGQVFFSLTIGFGVMIAYASYRPKNADVTNNAFIISFANCATSFVAGFAVFSVLGFLAYSQGGVPVSSVVEVGPGLAFVTYPTAISKMGELGRFWPPVMAVAFFVMLLTLGIDSLFSLTEGIVAGLHDRYPRMKRGAVVAAMCGFCFVVGVFVFANRAGLKWLDVFDHWANDYGLAVVGLLQCLIVGYLYKTDELRDYINEVSEIRLWGWWELCVRLLAPAVLIFLLATQFVNELDKGELYGFSPGSASNGYLWAAPAGFAALFVIAFALSKRWTNLKLVAGGFVVFLVAMGMLKAMSSGADFDLRVKVTHDAADRKKVTLSAEGAPEGAKFRWRLSDETVAEGRSLSHTFAKEGEFSAAVIALKGEESAAAETTIHAAPLIAGIDTKIGWHPQLVKGAEGPERRLNPLCILFSAKVSAAADLLFVWNFGEDAWCVATRGPHVRHVYKNPGEYKVALRVFDPEQLPDVKLNQRDAALAKRVERFPVELTEVEIVVPELVARVKADRIAGEAPLLVKFRPEIFKAVSRGEPERVADVSKYAFSWDFGDGVTAKGYEVSNLFVLREKPCEVSLNVNAGDGKVVPVAGELRITARKSERAGASAAVLCALAVTILFGGLMVCIGIARRGRAAPEEGD